jgi:anti-sigma-K factor RskA
MENELETLAEQIHETERHLAELRKEYRERKTAGLRAAIDARNDADKVIREELKALGYRDPMDFWRGRAL